MPEYQTITPPFWRGYILIECWNGKTYKYVRNVTKRLMNPGTNWQTANYSPYIWGYVWGDWPGDVTESTGDTAGRILFDYNRLTTLITARIAALGQCVPFPEFGGDTLVLARTNLNQLQSSFSASSPNNIGLQQIPAGTGTGDTNSWASLNIQASTFVRITSISHIGISLIQERIPEWNKTKQLNSVVPLTDFSYNGFGTIITSGIAQLFHSNYIYNTNGNIVTSGTGSPYSK